MTDTTPTDRESVEKLAKVYETFAIAEAIWKKATKRFDKLVAATLRALLTRAETAEARVDRLEAENARLRETLAANIEAMDAFGITGGAIDAARAALAKET